MKIRRNIILDKILKNEPLLGSRDIKFYEKFSYYLENNTDYLNDYFENIKAELRVNSNIFYLSKSFEVKFRNLQTDSNLPKFKIWNGVYLILNDVENDLNINMIHSYENEGIIYIKNLMFKNDEFIYCIETKINSDEKYEIDFSKSIHEDFFNGNFKITDLRTEFRNSVIYTYELLTLIFDEEIKILEGSNTFSDNSKNVSSIEDLYKELNINIIDARWYTEINNNNSFKVSGFWRNQPFGKGRKDIKKIWIENFEKKGYHRNAKKD